MKFLFVHHNTDSLIICWNEICFTKHFRLDLPTLCMSYVLHDSHIHFMTVLYFHFSMVSVINSNSAITRIVHGASTTTNYWVYTWYSIVRVFTLSMARMLRIEIRCISYIPQCVLLFNNGLYSRWTIQLVGILQFDYSKPTNLKDNRLDNLAKSLVYIRSRSAFLWMSLQ